MRTIINYETKGTQISQDEPDEFSLNDQERQIRVLEEENTRLESKNAELAFHVQYLEKIIAEYADGLCHTYEPKEITQDNKSAS